MLKTVAHEMRHAYQNLCVQGLYIIGYPRYNSIESYETLVIWDRNLNNYISSNDYNAYKAQPIEVAARIFANQET